ncbi:transglycosylase domain-containing protein [Kineosporia succinea]
MARPVAPGSDPYNPSSRGGDGEDRTAVFGASPYDELGREAQSPDGMSGGRRAQNRLRDSRAGRMLANTGALSLFGGAEDEELDSRTARARGARAPGGRGGGAGLPPQGYHRYVNYPRWGRTGLKRWLPSWKLVTGIFAFFTIMAFGVVFWFYNSVAIPKQDPEMLAQTTTVYYADGKTEMGRLSVQNRQNVDLAQVPKEVQDAVVAAEDKTFWSNSGVNPTSIARALVATVKGGNQQGGSTISQQYVKNVYNQRELSYKRKLNEAVLAIKINQTLEKEEIFERYLNTIYWGRGAWGIQAASKAYFNKDVEKLTPTQGAFLAGIINAPEAADPRDEDPTRKERAERRWGVVADAMVENGTITADERAKMKFPNVIKEKTSTSTTGQTAYLMEMVKEEAEDAGIAEDDLTTGGYKITTTFNKRLVEAGDKAVKKWTKGAPKGLRVGMASVNPSTGGVLAIYGGTGIDKQLNQATKDRAQGASTFKPFTLIAALEDGVSLDSYYDGNSPRVIREGTKQIKNDSDTSYGWINLIKATASSVNTVYVDLNNRIGPEKTKDAAIAAGIPKNTPDLGSNLVNVLGTASVHPIDLATAYATFAAQGVHRPWHVINSITAVEGDRPVYDVPEKDTKGTRVFDKDAVSDLTYAMQAVVKEGSGKYAQVLNRPIAGKTGTSTASKSAWFAGFTPQVATVVGLHQVGKDGQSLVTLEGWGEFQSGIYGGSYPVRIWTDYMAAALEGKDVVDFPEPVHGGTVANASPTPEVSLEPSPSISPSVEPSERPTMPTQPTFTQQPTQAPTQQPTQSPEPTVSETPEPDFTFPGQGDDDDDNGFP